MALIGGSAPTLQGIRDGDRSQFPSLILRDTALPHRSLMSWEVVEYSGVGETAKTESVRRETGILCRALSALPPPPKFLLLEGGDVVKGSGRDFLGCYALELSGSVRAAVSVKVGAVKLALWTVQSDEPRKLVRSPVWRHVIRHDHYITRSPSGMWGAQTNKELGLSKSYLVHYDPGCLSPDRCREGKWLGSTGGSGWELDASLRCRALEALPEPPEILVLEGDVPAARVAYDHLGHYRLQREVHTTATLSVTGGVVVLGLNLGRRVRHYGGVSGSTSATNFPDC